MIGDRIWMSKVKWMKIFVQPRSTKRKVIKSKKTRKFQTFRDITAVTADT